MSGNSDYQNVEQSENQGINSRSRPTPFPCVECDMIFFDKYSLMSHSKSHLGDLLGKRKNPEQHSEDVASLRSSDPLALSLSPCSFSVERNNKARHITSLKVDNSFKPSPLPVSSEIPDLASTDANLFVLNSMPPINPSSDPQFKVPKSIHHSVVSGTSLHGSTSSSTHPLMYSQLGSRTIPCVPEATPHLRLPEQMVGRARFREFKIPRNNQLEEPVPIVLSDDEEEKEDGSTEAIDLTLKL
ncbi:hypothetical protein ACS0TY_023380 [Phlomoides rotata]